MISPLLKNINELPVSIQAVVMEFTHKLLIDLEGNIISIVVYGSAAGGHYHPAVSNINMAVIVKNLDFSVLKQNLELVKWGRKRRIATPLFLTKEYILNSLDVFPVEFTEIKERHKVVFGEEIFKDLDVPLRDLSLLCEQQVKGKLLHLRQAYLEIGQNSSILKNLLRSVLNDLIPIFRQLIMIKGQKPCEHKEEMLAQLAQIFSLDQKPFLAVYHDKNKKALITSHQVESYFQNFISQLEILSRQLDSL